MVRINECPKCKQGKGYTIDSRPSKPTPGSQVIRRRRECGHCKYRWSTYEITDNEYSELIANNSQIAYNLIRQFKIEIDEWLSKNKQ